MKPANLKKVTDFIHCHNQQYGGRELKELFSSDRVKFIEALGEAIKTAEVVPTFIMPFYKELSQLHNAEEQTMETSNQSNQENEPTNTITYIFVEKVVVLYNRIKSFLAGNIDKIKAVGATLLTASLAYFARAHAGLLIALAAVKSQGILSVIKNVSDGALSKAVEVKDFVMNKAKSAIAWVAELFTSNDSDMAYAA